MARTFELNVLTPAETLLEVPDAAWVHLRLVDGTGITVYPGHAPLLAETTTAPLRYAGDDGEHVLEVEAGILQVGNSQVVVFTSGRPADKVMPGTPSPPSERRFKRLARELRVKLEGEPDSPFGEDLTADYEEK